MGTIAAAREYAVDLILRELMGVDWTPRLPNAVVILIDDPATATVLVRYHQLNSTRQWSTDRLCFEEAPNGTVYVTPCPPRTTRRIGATRHSLAWPFPSPNFDRLLDLPS